MSKTIAELAKGHKCGPQCEFRRGVLPDGVFTECLQYELVTLVNKHEETIAAQTLALIEAAAALEALAKRFDDALGAAGRCPPLEPTTHAHDR